MAIGADYLVRFLDHSEATTRPLPPAGSRHRQGGAVRDSWYASVREDRAQRGRMFRRGRGQLTFAPPLLHSRVFLACKMLILPVILRFLYSISDVVPAGKRAAPTPIRVPIRQVLLQNAGRVRDSSGFYLQILTTSCLTSTLPPNTVGRTSCFLPSFCRPPCSRHRGTVREIVWHSAILCRAIFNDAPPPLPRWGCRGSYIMLFHSSQAFRYPPLDRGAAGANVLHVLDLCELCFARSNCLCYVF